MAIKLSFYLHGNICVCKIIVTQVQGSRYSKFDKLKLIKLRKVFFQILINLEH